MATTDLYALIRQLLQTEPTVRPVPEGVGPRPNPPLLGGGFAFNRDQYREAEMMRDQGRTGYLQLNPPQAMGPAQQPSWLEMPQPGLQFAPDVPLGSNLDAVERLNHLAVGWGALPGTFGTMGSETFTMPPAWQAQMARQTAPPGLLSPDDWARADRALQWQFDRTRMPWGP